ncbi:hypothetical protein B0H10DRAFT_2218131 [Mycena sp. CBHHK59/15]|nr:hypothetical protein B0H10DRAFT_2218131 [Mycena sp. CBHHK59/15]
MRLQLYVRDLGASLSLPEPPVSQRVESDEHEKNNTDVGGERGWSEIAPRSTSANRKLGIKRDRAW